MSKRYLHAVAAGLMLITASCNTGNEPDSKNEPVQAQTEDSTNFEWKADRFADIQVLRYQIPGFEQLSHDQKKLVYYLVMAGLSGRDIIYDQNYRHNLEIRKALEKIVENFDGDKNSEDWKKFMEYTKRVWFSNGIHHHYSMAKINPAFSKDYFAELKQATGTTLSEEAERAIFDPAFDAKKVNLDPSKGLLKGSATNLYGADVTADEVEKYYASRIDQNDHTPIAYGLNSKMVKKADGSLEEKVYKVDGLYGPALQEVVSWLEKATTVAENDKQREALNLLIKYYKTGDLEVWDQYNIAWVEATEGDIDYINGFVEVYNDPLGYRGSYETIVEITDFEASKRMEKVGHNAQWFEDNSPILDAHKKDSVVGITYKVVAVAGESGDASPSTPIGVNLPNSNWIRAQHGSKSVSLGNIIHAYDMAGGSGLLEEFANDQEEIDRAKEYGVLAGKMHTALHEVVGHASGQLEKGVGQPAATLKNYASALEEGRADLVALYYLMDPKLVELNLMPSLEVGKAEYDSYIRNGMLLQLRRLEPGADIEESHMRNRSFISHWVYEKGKADSVIVKEVRDGKIYYDIKDYEALRELFGELLREVQRIKSQGDFEAGRDLVENYGVKVDPNVHEEVLRRSEKLNIAPYSGFINPILEPETDENGEITDIKVKYPKDFTEQMLYYGHHFSFL